MNTMTRYIVRAACSIFAISGISARVLAQPASTTAPSQSLQMMASEGTPLSDSQAANLESRVKSDPNDVKARAELLGYYFGKQYTNSSTLIPRRGHVLSMVKNEPSDPFCGSPFCSIEAEEDPDGYIAERDLWKQQIEAFPNSAQVLSNAASFFGARNPDLAEPLLQKAEKLEPQNPTWPDELGQLYSLQSRNPSRANAGRFVQKAVDEFELAMKLTTSPEERFYRMTNLCTAAFAAGDFEHASSYAEQLLKDAPSFKSDWNYGNAIFDAHFILGRIAFQNGDIARAKSELLASGQTKGSPQLDSFGPNMTLAKELLTKGERDTVIQYLESCGKFWSMGAEKLKSWSETIKAGNTPDFGANLDY